METAGASVQTIAAATPAEAPEEKEAKRRIDPELQAMGAMAKLLDPFPYQTRHRILLWLQQRNYPHNYPQPYSDDKEKAAKDN